MHRYVNGEADSDIKAFELSSDSITVEFSDGTVYLYDCSSAGVANIQQMKQLALSGRGLNTYINNYAKRDHAVRIR